MKKILFFLLVHFSMVHLYSAVEGEPLPSLWDAAAELSHEIDPKEAYIVLLFTRTVWLKKFGIRCSACGISNCSSKKFFDLSASSILLNRATLEEQLADCARIPCLKESTELLKKAATNIAKTPGEKINYHTASILFEVCTLSAKKYFDTRITPADHEACISRVQISILSS